MFALGIDDFVTFLRNDDRVDLSDLALFEQEAVIDKGSIGNRVQDSILNQDRFGLWGTGDLVRSQSEMSKSQSH